MKRAIVKILSKAGYRLVPLAPSGHGAMEGAIRRLSRLGILPKTIVDVGAAEGNWTRLCQTVWPDSNYELIEPLKEREKDLLSLTWGGAGEVRVHKGVAGSEPGEVDFSVSDDLDGSGVYGKGNIRKVQVLTIDSVCSDRSGPFLIKLDTHGYEVPVLEGARSVLNNTDALIIEVYGFFVSPTALLFHQLSQYLIEKGFRLFDIVDVTRRQKDDAFWQADAVYLRSGHDVFKDNTYR